MMVSIVINPYGSYNQAANNMQQSLWYRQTPNRAKRRIKEMRTGEYHKYV